MARRVRFSPGYAQPHGRLRREISRWVGDHQPNDTDALQGVRCVALALAPNPVLNLSATVTTGTVEVPGASELPALVRPN